LSNLPLLIANPAAQGGRAGRRWPLLAERLRASTFDFELAMTSGPGDATRLARAAVRGHRPLVVAGGGDGTINEVVNGFFEDGVRIESPTRFGILPLGTGGDFRRSVGIPADPILAAAALARGEPRRLDLGRAWFAGPDGPTSRHFLNVADVGIGGEVAVRVASSSGLPRGELTFLLASIRTLLTWRNKPLHIVIDGEPIDLVCQQVVVANGQYYGGGMRIAPQARVDDGLLDVIVVGDVNLWENLRGLRRIRSGTHLVGLTPRIFHTRARRIEVSSPVEVKVDLDGEPIGCLPAVFEIEPGALSLAQSAVSPRSGNAAGRIGSN